MGIRWTNKDELTHRIATLQRSYQRAVESAVIQILGVGGYILQRGSSSSMR